MAKHKTVAELEAALKSIVEQLERKREELKS